MSKKHKHKAGRRRYVVESLYHCGVDDSDIVATPNDATWHESLCGKWIQFGRQQINWPWCPKCLDQLNTTSKFSKPASIKQIVEQQFNPSSELVERIQRENKGKPVVGVVQKSPVGRGAAIDG